MHDMARAGAGAVAGSFRRPSCSSYSPAPEDFPGMVFVDPRMSTPAQPRYVPQAGVEPPRRSLRIAEMTEAEDVRWC